MARAAIDRLAEHVQDAAQRRVANRHRDRSAEVDRLHAADEAVGARHGDAAHLVLPDVLLHLERQVDGHRAGRVAHEHRVVDLRQLLGRKLDVDNGADDLDDVADVLLGRGGGHLPCSPKDLCSVLGREDVMT